MTIKKIVIIILFIMIAGCAALPPAEDSQAERQTIDIYNNQGKAKEHVIIKDEHVTIYDKDWNTKGYGKVQK